MRPSVDVIVEPIIPVRHEQLEQLPAVCQIQSPALRFSLHAEPVFEHLKLRSVAPHENACLLHFVLRDAELGLPAQVACRASEGSTTPSGRRRNVNTWPRID